MSGFVALTPICTLVIGDLAMIPVCGAISLKEAEELALVMAASKIECMIRKGPEGYELVVDEGEQDQAVAVMNIYWRENPKGVGVKAFRALERSWSGIFVALMLLAVFLRTGPLDRGQETVRLFAAHASRISSGGEIYRCVTALFLHAGWPHLVGNMAGIAIFATGVMQISGDGAGWLMVLVSAAAANWINARLFAVMGHVSFGASTAVFAAAGILSAYNTVRRYKEGEPLLRVVLPLGAGAAILSFVGTGPGSDITGHLLGFLVGAVVGALFSFYGKKKSQGMQTLCLTLSVVLCALSFLMGTLSR